MCPTRINHLRQMIHAIGEQQKEYYDYFPKFADKLVDGLGKYLGDKKCVALTTNRGDFNFETQYRHEGLGFEKGRYRIPIMIKLGNLNDSGHLLCRLRLYCIKNKDVVSVAIDEDPPIESTGDDLEKLYEHTYKHLQEIFSRQSWFEEHSQDYRCTKIGFHADNT